MHVDILLSSWTAFPDLSTEKKSSAAVHIPGLGDLVIGGCNNSRSLSNAELLKSKRVDEGTVFYWTEINPMIRPKSAPIAEYFDKRVYVFGVSFDMEMLSILSGVPGQWTLIIHHSLPYNMATHSMCVFNGKILVSGKFVVVLVIRLLFLQ